jgi:hypothetical protein
MSIHSTLAVLMGSTALGGSLPVTLWSVIQHSVFGNRLGALLIFNSAIHMPIAPEVSNFAITNYVRHGFIAGVGLALTNSIEHIIEGFYGIMITNASEHSALIMTDLAGYGYDYGDLYGGPD